MFPFCNFSPISFAVSYAIICTLSNSFSNFTLGLMQFFIQYSAIFVVPMIFFKAIFFKRKFLMFKKNCQRLCEVGFFRHNNHKQLFQTYELVGANADRQLSFVHCYKTPKRTKKTKPVTMSMLQIIHFEIKH